jgi:hypothetical protein
VGVGAGRPGGGPQPSPAATHAGCAWRAAGPPASEQLDLKDSFDALSLQRLLADEDPPEPVAVREALRGYQVESASAADYDRLLKAVVG